MENATDLIERITLLTSTKDSIHIKWAVQEDYAASVQGFKIQYQAMGSSIVQQSQELERRLDHYDILQLHEDTYYNICVHVIHNLTATAVSLPCIRATTHVDSLSVALGSTFGAFICLGIIVFFVFLAKWNHNRKMRKNLQAVNQTSENYDSMGHQDGEFEMSDVSLHVHEGTTTQVDVSSQSSLSGTKEPQANGIDHLCDGDISDVQNHNNVKRPSNTVIDVPTSTIVDTSDDRPIAIDPPPFSRKTKRSQSVVHGGARAKTKPMLRGMVKQQSMDCSGPPRDTMDDFHRDSYRDATREPIREPIREAILEPRSERPKKDYGGGRPKEYGPNDPRRQLYANKTYMDVSNQPPPLRPNLSW